MSEEKPLIEFTTDSKVIINGIEITSKNEWDRVLKEIERLNNIINELENHCETMLSIFGQMTDEQRQEQLDRYKIYDGFLRRIQRLKGDSSNGDK